MGRYVVGRLVGLVVVLVGASVVLFVCLFVMPGDPVTANAGEGPRIDAATRATLVHRFGLDRSLPEQYFRYASRLVHGDMGESFRLRRPVNDVLRPRVMVTAELAVAATAIEVLIGVGAAVVAALRHRSFVDSALRVSTAVAISVPTFVVGLALQHTFSVRWHLFPLRGAEGGFRALILPSLTLGSLHAGVVARLVRTSLADVGESAYIRAARGKGLSARAVVRHQLRSALLTVVTYLGVGFGALLGGAVITETIFNRDGLGLATVNAIRAHDNPIVVAITAYSIVVFVVVNLLVDLSYPLLDPRVRLGRRDGAGS